MLLPPLPCRLLVLAPGTATSTAEAMFVSSRKRGGLKQAGSAASLVGERKMMPGRHADGQPLSLIVQGE